MLQITKVSLNRGTARLFRIAVAVTMCATAAFAQTSNPALRWEKYFGDNRNWYEHDAVAAAPTGELFIGVNSKEAFTEKLSAPRVWRFNQNGERTADLEVKNLNLAGSDIHPERLRFAGLSISQDGSILAVLTDRTSQLLLVKMDPSGTVFFAKPVPVKQTIFDLRIGKVLWAEDHLFLTGHHAFDAYVAKVELTAEVAWERRVDRGRMEMFVDGIVTEDGGILLVANMGQYDMFRNGPSEAWLSKFSATGVEVRTPAFVGRYGSLARSSGNYWLVYDKSNTAGQDIWVKVLGPDLKQITTSKIISTKVGFTHFRIAPSASGGCVVVGEDDDQPYMAALAPSGNVVGSLTQSHSSSAVQFDLVAAGENFFVVSSPFVEDERHKSSRKVDLMKVIVN